MGGGNVSFFFFFNITFNERFEQLKFFFVYKLFAIANNHVVVILGTLKRS